MAHMSRWTRRGQCQGRCGPRAGSESRRQRQEGQVARPVYRPVSRKWQQRQCRKLRLPFVRTLSPARPKPPPLLRNEEPCLIHETGGDGNCLFRCLSLVITGSESQHNTVRQRIVDHISRNSKAFSALLPESSGNGSGHTSACAQYLSSSKMAAGATWGSDVEILAAAHLLRTRIFVYTLHGPAWQWVEHGLELTDPGRRTSRESIYLMHTGLVHYDLVNAVKQCSNGGKSLSSGASQPQSKRDNENAISRSRGCSVPCHRSNCRGARDYRSNSRSSSCSSKSNFSGSGHSDSDDCCSSCGESVCSAMSNTSISQPATASLRRRQEVTPNSRQKFPSSRSFSCNNNNCISKKPNCRSQRKAVRSFQTAQKHVRKYTVRSRYMMKKSSVNIKKKRRSTCGRKRKAYSYSCVTKQRAKSSLKRTMKRK